MIKTSLLVISRDGFIVESNKNLIFALRYILK